MSQTVSFIDLSEVMERLGFEAYEREFIYNTAFNEISWGDASYTLIENNWTLDCIVDYYEAYHRENIANKSMTEQMLRDKFWQIVGEQDYINMEG